MRTDLYKFELLEIAHNNTPISKYIRNKAHIILKYWEKRQENQEKRHFGEPSDI